MVNTSKTGLGRTFFGQKQNSIDKTQQNQRQTNYWGKIFSVNTIVTKLIALTYLKILTNRFLKTNITGKKQIMLLSKKKIHR